MKNKDKIIADIQRVRENPSRKGVLVGAYVSRDIKAALLRKAAAVHTNLSEIIRKIFADAVREDNKK